MKSINNIFFAAVLLLPVLAFSAEREKKVFRAAVDPDGVQRVEVVGGEYYFDPYHIVVKVNVPVELTVKKTPGIVPHNVILNAPDADMDINITLKKDPSVVKFTPKKAGKYPFFCDKKLLFFKSHREKGMEGILEVVD